MSGRMSKRIAVIITTGLLLAACGSNDAAIKQYAKSHAMPEIQTAAFLACARETQGKKLFFPVKEGNLAQKAFRSMSAPASPRPC